MDSFNFYGYRLKSTDIIAMKDITDLKDIRHQTSLDLGKVNHDRRTFVWLSNAPFSLKHGCESGKHFKTIKLEAFLWITKTCSNHNSSYNYIKNICFELSFLTYIPALYTITLIKINRLIDYKMSSSYQSLFSLISICSQLNTTKQKKVGLYIFC